MDRNSIRTGEPITLKLSAVWPGKPGFATGFTIPDSLPHFDIWEKQNAVIVKDGIEQILTITSYDSGRFNIPAFTLASSGRETDKEYATNAINIQVTPVNVDSLQDYHDIKDIIEVAPIEQWPYIVGIAVLTLLAGIGLYILLKKLGVGKKPARRQFENAMHPYPAAMQALDQLAADYQQQSVNSKQFFTRLTDIYRIYLSDAHDFRSHQQTGGELILQAKPLLPQDLFFQFANAIRLSDAAKFAKYEPPKEEWITSVKSIKESITALEKKVTSPAIS